VKGYNQKEAALMNVLNVPVAKYTLQGHSPANEHVAMEEPLEICIDGEPFYMTMRLPGEEIPLALGLCFTEGIIRSMDDVSGANYCGDLSANKINVFLSEERKSRPPLPQKQKRSVTYSSCGLCGSDMIEDLGKSIEKIKIKTTVEFPKLSQMQQAVVEKQDVHRATRGTHAAGIFDAQGNLLSFAEDVGRHNALDKAIGKILFERRIHEAAIVHLSSRLSYEMVMKTARLGAEILTGVSSATSLAIELASATGITLIGSFRENRGNVFTYPERLLVL
jgi:FdhD protein